MPCSYGQTGSGKTYSMMGAPGDEGLTPRLCQNMFDKIQEIQEQGGNGYKIAIETSYFEIYNEKVFDLLASECIGVSAPALPRHGSTIQFSTPRTPPQPPPEEKEEEKIMFLSAFFLVLINRQLAIAFDVRHRRA